MRCLLDSVSSTCLCSTKQNILCLWMDFNVKKTYGLIEVISMSDPQLDELWTRCQASTGQKVLTACRSQLKTFADMISQ